jgi:hypothetical protein
MHVYAWYVWWKTIRSGSSLKVRLGRDEVVAFLEGVAFLVAANCQVHSRPSSALLMMVALAGGSVRVHSLPENGIALLLSVGAFARDGLGCGVNTPNTASKGSSCRNIQTAG